VPERTTTTISITSDSYREASNFEWQIGPGGGQDWADIDYIAFTITSNAIDAYIYIDGLAIEGVLTRAAYDTAKIGSQKCRMIFIHDDLPKDDTLEAADDSGQIGQLLKAELYRGVTEPITGRIQIPLQPQIKGGQLAHIHFAKQASGAFRVDKDMRITEVTHHNGMDGATSILTLTDDVKNSLPRQPINAYNALLKAVAPDFQDRVRGSLVANQVDITQTLLSKTYATP